LVFHSSLPNQSNDLQRQCCQSIGSILAHPFQRRYSSGRWRTSVQSIDLLDSSPLGHELDLLVLFCLESDHGEFLSNAKRFSDGFHGFLQVSTLFGRRTRKRHVLSITLVFFFSVILLRKRVTIIQGAGILTVVAGLVVVGVVDLYFDTKPEGKHTDGEKFAGIILILVAMVFTSLQVSRREGSSIF
jgi:hypothetical protein